MDKGVLVGSEIDKAINNVFAYLDTIDLHLGLVQFKHKTVREFMEWLNMIPYEDEYSSCLFDAVAEDEFVDYLNRRYGLNLREETVSYYYIR